ncbi:MAG: ComF family protein [Lachnospiraceae bacterium]|nr:ComF family protein [Lachnospiraceae bacterium]
MTIIKELLFPRRCPVCDKPAPWGEYICPACAGRLKPLGRSYCLKCGKGLTKEEWEYCADCQKYPHVFDRGRSLYTYESAAGAIFRLKYKGRQEYADFFAEEWYRYLADTIRSWQIDLIVPVPLHRSRRRTRGYNQAELLAKALGRRLQLPVSPACVIRCRKTISQKQLNRVQRQNNLKNAFKMNRVDVQLKGVLLVDDIYTTGSTADAVASVLKKAGAARVYILTLAAGTE